MLRAKKFICRSYLVGPEAHAKVNPVKKKEKDSKVTGDKDLKTKRKSKKASFRRRHGHRKPKSKPAEAAEVPEEDAAIDAAPPAAGTSETESDADVLWLGLNNRKSDLI